MTDADVRRSPGMNKITIFGALAATALTVALTGTAAHADNAPHMPAVKGKALVDAYQALNYNTHIKFVDGRGAGRHVLWPANWKVCEQSPAAGAPLNGANMKDATGIRLTVVKRAESC